MTDRLDGDEDEVDFIVSHPLTRLGIAGKLPPMKSLSTINEESFSSVESSHECTNIEVTPRRDNTIVDMSDMKQDEDKSAGPSATPPRPQLRASRRANSSGRRGDSSSNRGTRTFLIVVVSMILVDVVLFIIAYAWTPMYFFSLVLLGMIMGMLVAVFSWHLARSGTLCGEADDADSVSHGTHSEP